MTKHGILTVTLIGLAVLQVGYIVRGFAGTRPTRAPVRFLVVGDTVTTLSGSDGPGVGADEKIQNGAGRWTALLAFSSTCPYTKKSAPAWATWLRKPHSFGIIAVTRDSANAGVTYAHQSGWPVRVVSRPNPHKGSTMAMLSTRTPWVFLVDPRGVVRFEAHGARIAALDSVARALENPVHERSSL